MTPRHFVDVVTSGVDDGAVSPVVARGEAFLRLHRIFSQHPAVFALGIPERPALDTLRVFASTADELHTLVDEMARRAWFRDYTRLGEPRVVPDGWAGARFAFARYRISTVKSDRHAVNGVSMLRDRRLEQARKLRLDHFRVRSGSTSSSFSLTVERLDGRSLPWHGLPNSYGLCGRVSPFAVPMLP